MWERPKNWQRQTNKQTDRQTDRRTETRWTASRWTNVHCQQQNFIPVSLYTGWHRNYGILCHSVTQTTVYKNNSSAGRETAWSLVSLFRYGKSLKVIWNDTLEYIYIQRDPVVTMSVCRTVSEIYSASKWYDHQNQGYRGHSRLLKMPPFDRPHTTYYQSAIVIALVYVISFLSYLTISSSKWSIMCRMVR